VVPITNSAAGRVLFAIFMVITNWAILAIVTSVVSDNMISTSRREDQLEEVRAREQEHLTRVRRLTALFDQIDLDGSGVVSKDEWNRMMADPGLHSELLDATGLLEQDLHDYFECLATDQKTREALKLKRMNDQAESRQLEYKTFITSLKDEGVVADKRSIMHVLNALRGVERGIFAQVQDIVKAPRLSQQLPLRGHAGGPSVPGSQK